VLLGLKRIGCCWVSGYVFEWVALTDIVTTQRRAREDESGKDLEDVVMRC
jgi:hypothetical protein